MFSRSFCSDFSGCRPLVGNPPLIVSFVLAIPKERVTGAFSEIPIPHSCVFQLQFSI